MVPKNLARVKEKKFKKKIVLRPVCKTPQVLDMSHTTKSHRFCSKKKKKEENVVYCESIKRELKTRPIYDCRCDERLKTKE